MYRYRISLLYLYRSEMCKLNLNESVVLILPVAQHNKYKKNTKRLHRTPYAITIIMLHSPRHYWATMSRLTRFMTEVQSGHARLRYLNVTHNNTLTQSAASRTRMSFDVFCGPLPIWCDAPNCVQQSNFISLVTPLK